MKQSYSWWVQHLQQTEPYTSLLQILITSPATNGDNCHKGTAIKHSVLDQVKSSFDIFDIRAMQNLDKQIWRSRITITTKLKLYNTCILPIFLYGSDCWAVTKRDVLKIEALDQWCLRKLLGIKWYHHVRNDEVRRTTGQPRLSAIVQARRLSLFGHIARMLCETDARNIIHNCFPFGGLEESTRTSSNYVDETI